MTRIYEAIQLAEAPANRTTLNEPVAPEQRAEPATRATPAETGPLAPTPPMASPLADTMSELYSKITAGLPSYGGRIIEFTGVHPGAGASTIVQELAKVVAVRHRKSVLLLDANANSGSNLKQFEVQPSLGWDQALSDGEDVEGLLHPVADTGLSVSQLRSGDSEKTLLSAIPELEHTLSRLRKSFDLVLIDAPPTSESSDCFSLSSMVDGVVIVLEAEKSRWQVANSVQSRFENSGAKILGAVLNKRRYHVPKRIYELL